MARTQIPPKLLWLGAVSLACLVLCARSVAEDDDHAPDSPLQLLPQNDASLNTLSEKVDDQKKRLDAIIRGGEEGTSSEFGDFPERVVHEAEAREKERFERSQRIRKEREDRLAETRARVARSRAERNEQRGGVAAAAASAAAAGTTSHSKKQNYLGSPYGKIYFEKYGRANFIPSGVSNATRAKFYSTVDRMYRLKEGRGTECPARIPEERSSCGMLYFLHLPKTGGTAFLK